MYSLCIRVLLICFTSANGLDRRIHRYLVSINPLVFIVDFLTTAGFSKLVTADWTIVPCGYFPQHPPCPLGVFPFINVLDNDLDNEVCPTYP